MAKDVYGTYRIDGVEYGPVLMASGLDEATRARSLLVGARASGTSNNFDLRNPKVGTDWGLGDIFDPALTSSIVPPFDSIVGASADMTISSGVITVLNSPAADVYALYDWGVDLLEVYASIDLFLRPEMLNGQTTADYMDVVDTSGLFTVMGIYNYEDAGTDFWNFADNPGGPGPTADVWIEVQMRVQIVPSGEEPPVDETGGVFDGGLVFEVT